MKRAIAFCVLLTPIQNLVPSNHSITEQRIAEAHRAQREDRDDDCSKEVLCAFAKLALGFGTICGGDLPDGVGIIAQGVSEFFTLAQDKCQLDHNCQPEEFANAVLHTYSLEEQVTLFESIVKFYTDLEPYAETVAELQ